MSNSVNIWIISGNLGKDPEMTYTPQGTAITKLSIALDGYDYKTKSSKTDWIRCTVFGKRAETCSEWLKKGSQVLVQGKLEINKWVTPEGDEKTFVEITATDVQFLSRMKEKQTFVEEEIYDPNDHNYAPF